VAVCIGTNVDIYLLAIDVCHVLFLAGGLQDLQGHCIPVLLGAGYCKDDSLFYLATSLVAGHHPTSDLKEALPLAEQVSMILTLPCVGVILGCQL
jgi:hypothetical protein